ncbi:MAG TPA: PHP domain-containing protein [Vicinamibacterales bacterium]|nr:PHP domain-containing protein [Vicinamibacterales bacterium]
MSTRIPLGRAHMLAATAIREARRAGLPTDVLTPVGSLRRHAPAVGDVSLLAVIEPRLQGELFDGFARLPMVTRVTGRTPGSVTVATDRGAVVLHAALPEHVGAALAWHTGSRRHTEQLLARASRMGIDWTPHHLMQGTTPLATANEEAFYESLALPFIPPELREGGGEIEAAERGELPDLVTDLHIRGDLHMHSTWSDGRDSIETMALACRELGYEYIAITDHSQRAWSSRKLALEDVPRQRDELEGVRARIPGIQILHGVEVDILKDGTLDFDDQVLSGFDIVLASLHDHGGQDAHVLTERYLKAIRHPLVNVITHPANRSPALSDGYDVDFDEMFAVAVETGTAMEVDGAPGHLDMDGELARRAATAGVTIAIDSDCHRAEALGRQMRFGVGTARRGWIEATDVLNTKGLPTVREFIARKRAGR